MPIETEEIDNLTRRCKTSESAYAALTKSLSDTPDPAAALGMALEYIHNQQAEFQQMQNSVDSLHKEKQALEKQVKQAPTSGASESGLAKREKEELMQLRKEVAEYEVEFRSLKNQDITIRKLEAKILELEQGGEDQLNDQLEKAKQELAETEGRRTAEALEREASMERRVQTLELQLKAEMAGRVATQAHLFEASEGAGEREAAWEAQREILIDDSERLRVDLHQATRERDELRLKVAALEGDAPSVPAAPSSGGIVMADLLSERKAYEAEVSELSHTVNSLRDELNSKEEAITEEKHELQVKIDSLDEEIKDLTSQVSSLESQLAAAPSHSLVESMKRELRILKRLEYNADDQEDEEGAELNKNGGNDTQDQDLESVLVAKLRKVEAELVKERNGRAELKEEVNGLREEMESLESAKVEAEKTVASLEQDLDKAIATSATPVKQPTTKPPEIITEVDPATLEHVLDPNTPVPEKTTETPKTPSTPSALDKASDDHSVATIIIAQRDRLRTRCDALEAERDSFKRELQVQADAAESLKTDNTKLFEKLRYLQSYNNKPGARSTAYSRNNSRDLDLEALEQRYEASVDPFRQFGRTERQRKLNEMSPMERTVYVVAKTVLGTKEMRTFLFFYVLAMHLLVFMTTYHWSHNDLGCSIEKNEHLSHLPPLTDKSAEEVMKDLSGT